MHPYAFFSHCFTPAGTNYDTEDWELLAIKLALEEWWQWLVGTKHPFIVWTWLLTAGHNSPLAFGQTERANLVLEAALCCIAFSKFTLGLGRKLP